MKNAKRVISFVLMLALILSICVVPAMAEESPKKYSFFGDSMTFNFVKKKQFP